MTRQTYRPVEWHWRRMPTATLGAGAGITPVQNTYYTVLGTTNNVRIKSIMMKQTNDEAAAKTIAIYPTLDGVSIANAVLLSNNSWVYPWMRSWADNVYLADVTLFMLARYCSLDNKTAAFQIRITDAVGTNQKLFASVQYESLVRI